MTREQALEALHKLAAGLPCDAGGIGRLRERVAACDEREPLLDVLVELGARALLDEGAA